MIIQPTLAEHRSHPPQPSLFSFPGFTLFVGFSVLGLIYWRLLHCCVLWILETLYGGTNRLLENRSLYVGARTAVFESHASSLFKDFGLLDTYLRFLIVQKYCFSGVDRDQLRTDNGALAGIDTSVTVVMELIGLWLNCLHLIISVTTNQFIYCEEWWHSTDKELQGMKFYRQPSLQFVSLFTFVLRKFKFWKDYWLPADSQ